MGKILKVIEYLYFKKQNFSVSLWGIFNLFYVRLYFTILIILNLFIWIFVYIIDSRTKDNLITLHYNVDFGINLIGQVKKIYILPLFGLIIIIINFVIILNTQKYRDSKFIIHILLFTAILSHLFLSAAAASLYLINFR